jgi:CheY-like chemotaxis protein
MNKPSVLIVDDDAIAREFIHDVVSKVLKLDTRKTSTIRETIEELKKKTPSLVFFDMDLFDGTGLELCEEMRKFPQLDTVPKWIISGADPLSWDPREWKSFGVLGYLVKPVSIANLVETVKNTLKV